MSTNIAQLRATDPAAYQKRIQEEAAKIRGAIGTASAQTDSNPLRNALESRSSTPVTGNQSSTYQAPAAPTPTNNSVSGQLTPDQMQIVSALAPEARHNYLMSLSGSNGSGGSGSAAGSQSKINPYNEIAYSKELWENGHNTANEGLKIWAAENAKQYYDMLSPEEAARVRDMDARQLNDFINQMKGGGLNQDPRQAVVPAPQTFVSSAQAPSGYQSTYKGFDLTGALAKLQQMFDSTRASGLTGIRNTRDTALQGYNAQETQAKQQATSQRNSADAQTMQAAQRLREVMANAGLTSSGDNITANVRLQNQGQAVLGNINQAEGNLLQDIGQKRALLNNQAASQEAALLQQINADQMARTLDLERYGDERALQMDNLNYGRYRDAVNDQFRSDQSAFERAMAEAGLTGNYSGQRTMQGQQFDWSRDPRNPSNVGQQLSNEMAQFNLEQARDPNSPINRKSALDLQLRELELANLPEEQKLRLQQLKAQIAQIGAAPYRSPEEVDYDKERVNLIKAQIDEIKSKPNEATQANQADRLYSDFLGSDLSRLASLEEGMAYINLARSRGVPEATLQKMIKDINKRFDKE